MDLSIIVPVYNVEKYIRPCIESIFKQGLDDSDFEVIIINDGTKDRSMEIIANIISQHNNITIINQNNQGLSVARNNGIVKSMGEYILMLDSDDLLIEYNLPTLLDVALNSKADMVVADFHKMSNEEIEQYKYTPQILNNISEKTGEQFFLEDLNPNECYVWRTLFKRDFLISNNICFVSGIHYQDVPFTHECCLKADKCIRVHWIMNIYRISRIGSATYSFDKKKAMDYCVVIAKTWGLRKLAKQKVLRKLQDNIFASFTSLIYYTSHDINDPTERNQIIDKLRRMAPDLVFRNGFKQKIFSYMFHKMPHTLIYLRRIYGRCFEDTIIPILRNINQAFITK